MGPCHPISTKHRDERTQQYHLLAVQEGKGGDVDEELGLVEGAKESRISPEVKQRIDNNKKNLKRALRALATQSRFKTLLVPVATFMWAYDGMSKKVADYKERAKNEEELKMAETYQKTADSFIDKVPTDATDWSPEEYEKLMDSTRKDMEACVTAIKEKGKNCPEYAMYRAYRDLQTLYETRYTKLLAKVEEVREQNDPSYKLTDKQKRALEEARKGFKPSTNRKPRPRPAKDSQS